MHCVDGSLKRKARMLHCTQNVTSYQVKRLRFLVLSVIENSNQFSSSVFVFSSQVCAFSDVSTSAVQACVSAALAAHAAGMMMVDLRVFICSMLHLSWILSFPVCTTVLCAPHKRVLSMVTFADCVGSVCFPFDVPADAVAVAAIAGLNVSCREETERMQPNLKYWLRLEPFSEPRRHRCHDVGFRGGACVWPDGDRDAPALRRTPATPTPQCQISGPGKRSLCWR